MANVPTVPFSVSPPTQMQTQGAQLVPASTQIITNNTCALIKLTVSNQGASATTLTITDNTSGVQIVPGISVSPGTVDVIDLGGVMANGGCSWVASAANSLNAWLRFAF